MKLRMPLGAVALALLPLALAPAARAAPAPVLLENGAVAPDFPATTPDGKTVHLSDYKGKPIVIDFWATWCGPCQQSMPHLNKVYKQVKDKDVVVLAVCVADTKEAYDKWVTTNKTTYDFPTAYDPAGRDVKNSSIALYHVSGIPTQFVIDKDGKIAASTVGYGGEDDHKLEAALVKLGVDIPAPAAAKS
jgi:peroxiredoxin